jgi:hypothetical protein
MLGYPSSLPGDNVCFPHRIEKRCLAVIHMTHNGNDRRPREEVLFLLRFFLKKSVNGVGFHLHIKPELTDDQRRDQG